MHIITRKRKIAIVGGGVFGSTLALDLDRAGLLVTLYERRDALLLEGSLANQYRLHRGFHYPRSPETIVATKAASIEFERRFPKCVLKGYKNMFAVASEGSKTDAGNYLEIMRRSLLDFVQIPTPDFLQGVDLCVVTEENLYDPQKLQQQITLEIIQSEIDLRLSTEFDWGMAGAFDAIILCTYGANDIILRAGGFNSCMKYRVQVVEKPVVELPSRLRKQSLVIMDGPFCSMDPVGDGTYSVVGHVDEANHYTKEGCDYVEPETYELLSYCRANADQVTRFEQMQRAVSLFIPEFQRAERVRSLWAVRVVPGNVTDTDERPTLVNRHSDTVFSVFSGKVSSCVTVFEKLKILAPELFH
jgi:hypothetical protein